MRKWILVLALALAFPFTSQAAPPAACGTGVTNCTNDTSADELLRAASLDPNSQARIYGLWVGECLSVFNEDPGTANHTSRVQYCGAVVGQKVPLNMLVWIVFASSNIRNQVLVNYPNPSSPLLGNMVDVDAKTAIDSSITGYGLAGTWPAP